jgi:RNA polymerase sigma-70 factor (ECF subfamily)
MSTAQFSSHDLFHRLARGEARAFEEVHARYGARVAAIAHRQLGAKLRARIETADLTQEAWLAIARTASLSFDDEPQFLAWVESIVERRVLREARRWRAQRRRLDREIVGVDLSAQYDRRAERPSHRIRREEAADQVASAILCLQDDFRRVIILRDLLELPWRAVAAALGVNEECAQMRHTRARRRLAQLACRAAGSFP